MSLLISELPYWGFSLSISLILFSFLSRNSVFPNFKKAAGKTTGTAIFALLLFDTLISAISIALSFSPDGGNSMTDADAQGLIHLIFIIAGMAGAAIIFFVIQCFMAYINERKEAKINNKKETPAESEKSVIYKPQNAAGNSNPNLNYDLKIDSSDICNMNNEQLETIKYIADKAQNK